MFFSEKKFQKYADELKQARYMDLQPITPFTAANADSEEIQTHVPDTISGMTLQLNDYIIGRDRYVWAQTTVTLPEHRNGCQVVGVLILAKQGADLIVHLNLYYMSIESPCKVWILFIMTYCWMIIPAKLSR